jgi:Zn-dependent protease
LRLSDLQTSILSFGIILLSLSFHEAAHAWTANRLGDPTARNLGRLTLNPLSHIDWIGTVLLPFLLVFSGLPAFGWAKPVPVNPQNLAHPRRDFAMVALAGPVSNLILATAMAVVYPFVLGGALGALAWSIIGFALLINVRLAVFNLVPIPPLDGGNILAGFVPEPVARLLDAIRPYGFIILIALLYTGLLWTVIRPVERVIFSWLT